MQYVEVDHIVPSSELSSLLTKLTESKAPKRPNVSKDDMDLLKMEVIIANHDNAFEIGILDMGDLTTFACPECKGALVSITEGQMIRYRCHTGHAYTSSTLLAGITLQVEEKLGEAMQGIESTAMLLNQIAKQYKSIGNQQAAQKFKKEADRIAKRARTIHDSVFTQKLLSEDHRFDRPD